MDAVVTVTRDAVAMVTAGSSADEASSLVVVTVSLHASTGDVDAKWLEVDRLGE